MTIPRGYLRFWSGPPISRVQLARFRLVFFALVAIDAFLIVARAPHYGAGGFNVGHFPILAPLTPTFDRLAIVVSSLVLCYLAARVAVGVAIRWLVIPVAVIYAAIYFSSQLDSFQHHYLLALMLITCCMVDWKSEEPTGVPIRLLLLQVSVVYVFAAISKMEAGWWSGHALEAMVGGLDENAATDLLKLVGFPAAAKLIVLTELVLAIAIQTKIARVPAAIVGIGFHLGIEITGFRIGLFSYYMVAFYLLVLPPSAFRFSALPAWRWRPTGIPLVAALAIAAAIGIGLIATLPLEGAWIAAVVIAAFAIGRQRRVALAHIVAAIAVVACAHTTDAMRDHYRFLGGSARRLGDSDAALAAYERLASIEPSYASGRRNLGRMYVAAGELEKAETEYLAAARLEPDSVASQLGLAQLYAKQGRKEDAVRHARLARQLAEKAPDSASRAMQQAVRQAGAIERRFGGGL